MVYNEGIRMGAGGKPMVTQKPVEVKKIVEKPKPVELQEIIEKPKPVSTRKKVVVLEERVTDSLPTEVEVGE
jgi:hypothetical protein